jgi:peptidoglycan/xylan/chitin deacetylase (PgdA/CDA1 family)
MTGAVRALVRRLARRPVIVHRASGEPPAVALTFDDGPSEWTAAVADALERHGCRGTFFVLGVSLERRPETVRALVAAGHELGNHLWSHSDPAAQSRGQLRREIDRTAAAITELSGRRPSLVRPPYCGAPRRVATAASGGRASHVVLRSVDPADWRLESASELVDLVLSSVRGGDIVCLHDGVSPGNSGAPTRDATAEGVALLVPALIERGLRPVTVSELLA